MASETRPVIGADDKDQITAQRDDHFLKLVEAYGYSDAIAIYTAGVWAKLLRESWKSTRDELKGRFPDIQDLNLKLKGLAETGGWQIGRKLGTFTAGQGLCVVSNYNLLDFTEDGRLLNPAFQRIQVASNIGGLQVRCVSMSKVWKFAGPDGEFDFLDLETFGEFYDTGKLQLIGLPQEEYFFANRESPTIVPPIPQQPKVLR